MNAAQFPANSPTPHSLAPQGQQQPSNRARVSIPESEISMSIVTTVEPVTRQRSRTRASGIFSSILGRRLFRPMAEEYAPRQRQGYAANPIRYPTSGGDDREHLIQHAGPSNELGAHRQQSVPIPPHSQLASASEEAQRAKPARSCCPRLGRVNVEPAILLIATAFGMLITAMPPLTFWLRCLELYHGEVGGSVGDLRNASAYCARISTATDANSTQALDAVEGDVAQAQIYFQAISTATTLFSAPILGAWSDYNGRRVAYILSITGITFYCSALMLGVRLYQAGITIYVYLACAELFGGLLGAASVGNLATTIVADSSRGALVHPDSGVPPRMAVACTLQMLGMVAGSMLTGLLSIPLGPIDPTHGGSVYVGGEEHVYGYLRITMMASFICLLAMFYVMLFLRETHNPLEGSTRRVGMEAVNSEQSTTSPTYLSQHTPHEQSQGCLIFLRSHLPMYMTSAFRVIVLPRRGWTRLCLCLTVIFIFVEVWSVDSQLFYLVVRRSPFEWDDSTFSNYVAARLLVASVGASVSPLVLRLCCSGGRVVGGESILLLLALTANMAALLVWAIATNTNQLFAALPLSLISGGLSPAFRTLLAKMVTKEQTASLFAVVSLVTVVSPLGLRTLFNEIYRLTMDAWPGFVFLVMAVLFAVAIGGQTVVHLLMRPLWLDRLQEEEEGAGRRESLYASSVGSEDTGQGINDSASVEALVSENSDGEHELDPHPSI